MQYVVFNLQGEGGSEIYLETIGGALEKYLQFMGGREIVLGFV